jgi:hypothetical protein
MSQQPRKVLFFKTKLPLTTSQPEKVPWPQSMPTMTAACSAVVRLTPWCPQKPYAADQKIYENDLPSALKPTLSSEDTYEKSHKEPTYVWEICKQSEQIG